MLTSQPRTKNIMPIQQLNADFTFDWNDYRTFATNEPKVASLEKIISENLAAVGEMNEKDKHAFGQLCYKLGTYYSHIKCDPDPAREKYEIAKKLLKDEELAWVKGHIALCYQQKMQRAKALQDKSHMDQFTRFAYKYCFEVTLPYERQDTVTKEPARILAFVYCVLALTTLEQDNHTSLSSAIMSYEAALDLYQRFALLDNQYAHAKLHHAQLLALANHTTQAAKAFNELENYWSQQHTSCNPSAADFFIAHAEYIAETEPTDTISILEKYKNAYLILKSIDPNSNLTNRIAEKVNQLQEKIAQEILDDTLNTLAAKFTVLPYKAREQVIESITNILLRGIVPMSGMTVQQPMQASSSTLKTFNLVTNKDGVYKNSTQPFFVYQFAREATSAGIVPVYRDKTNGDLYIGLICNKRNLNMYNWSAGYTEAPLPPWNDKLISNSAQEIYYQRQQIKDAATNTMQSAVEKAGGDWTKVEYDWQNFADDFKNQGVILPSIDLNSLHTAERECLEEINLDLKQFPDRKIFLISYDNTVGISQGDAPGQISNRSHQYMVYLGEYEQAPEIKPGDDVAIADWIKVSSIERKNAMEYFANGKPLCVYMLRGLELGLKNLWQYLLQQSSTQLLSNNEIAIRFSTPENVVAEINAFAAQNNISLKGSRIHRFLQSLTNGLQDKTYTGKSAQAVLSSLLEITKYLTGTRLDSKTFVKDLDQLLASTNPAEKLYSRSTNLTHFKPASVCTEVFPVSLLTYHPNLN